jgi:hypothetical protein
MFSQTMTSPWLLLSAGLAGLLRPYWENTGLKSWQLHGFNCSFHSTNLAHLVHSPLQTIREALPRPELLSLSPLPAADLDLLPAGHRSLRKSRQPLLAGPYSFLQPHSQQCSLDARDELSKNPAISAKQCHWEREGPPCNVPRCCYTHMTWWCIARAKQSTLLPGTSFSRTAWHTPCMRSNVLRMRENSR